MAKLNEWHDDEFVNYDEMSFYCNHSAEWTEKNRIACDRRGVPRENRCPFCERELKRNFSVLYVDDDPNSPVLTNELIKERGCSPRYFATPGPGRVPFKIGNTCLKAFEKAHGDIYGR